MDEIDSSDARVLQAPCQQPISTSIDMTERAGNSISSHFCRVFSVSGSRSGQVAVRRFRTLVRRFGSVEFAKTTRGLEAYDAIDNVVLPWK